MKFISDPEKSTGAESEDAPIALWLRLAIPSTFIILAMFGTLFYMHVTTWLLFFGLAIAYIVPPAGKETVIPSGVALGFAPWEMTYLLVMLDLAGALFIILNFGLAKRLPVLGRYIRFMERKGAKRLTDSTTSTTTETITYRMVRLLWSGLPALSTVQPAFVGPLSIPGGLASPPSGERHQRLPSRRPSATE